MSEVITSDSERAGHLNPVLRARGSAGSTEPMLAQDGGRRSRVKAAELLQLPAAAVNCRSAAAAPVSARESTPAYAERLPYIRGWRDPCLITY